MTLNRKEVIEIVSSLARLEVTTKEIKVDLKDHMRRTANVEGRTEAIEKHVHQVQGIMKFLAWSGAALVGLATVAGAVYVFLPH